MNKNITLVSHFDDKSNDEIQKIISQIGEDYKLCKVPFGRDVDRFKVDTLPFHLTVSAWNIKEEEFVISKLKQVNFKEIKVKISGLNIMRGKEDSYCLYFEVGEVKELQDLQREIYKVCPNEKYNPDNFVFHITIYIDKDYKKVIALKNVLEKSFSEIELIISNFGLYEIYPAKLVLIF